MTVSTLAREDGTFLVLALDEVLLVLAEVAKKIKDPVQQKQVYQELAEVCITLLDPHVSGYCIHNLYGYTFLPLLNQHKGIFFSLEKKTIDQDPLSNPAIAHNWSVTHAYHNAAGSKLELYYHPQEKGASEKRQLVAELSHHCHMLHTDFILDLRVLPKADESYLEILLESIKHFRSAVDTMIITPGTDVMASITITAELDVPWMYNQSTTSYTKYKKELRLSLEGGAAGCYLGQSILAGISRSKANTQTVDEVKEFILTEVRDRVLEVRRIVEDMAGSDQKVVY